MFRGRRGSSERDIEMVGRALFVVGGGRGFIS